MIDIQVTGLSIEFEVGRKILDGLSFQVDQGERVGLLGRNGAGKTTLFKLLTGELHPDEGEARTAPGKGVGLISQIPVYPPEYTVEDVLNTAFDHLRAMEREMAQLAEKMGEGDKATMARYDALMAAYERQGGYQTEIDLNKVCNGLDIPPAMRAQLFSDLSGGEKTRVNLARLILRETEILLLDEPTNHLDTGSCEALEEALSGYDGTLFVVSHDRYLINRLADKVYALTPQGTQLYLGNYDSYLEKREARQAIEEKKAAPRPNLYKQRKERDAELRKKKAALRRLEGEIEEKEEAVSALEKKLEDPAVAADYQAVAETSEEISKLRQEADALLLEWTELSEELES